MKRAGLNTEIFSGGGTGTYNIMTKVPGVTDVQVGSYIFMDASISRSAARERRALHRLRAVADGDDDGAEQLLPEAGSPPTPAQKALTLNKPDPIVIGEKGFAYNAGSDEFGSIQYETAEQAYRSATSSS